MHVTAAVNHTHEHKSLVTDTDDLVQRNHNNKPRKPSSDHAWKINRSIHYAEQKKYPHSLADRVLKCASDVSLSCCTAHRSTLVVFNGAI